LKSLSSSNDKGNNFDYYLLTEAVIKKKTFRIIIVLQWPLLNGITDNVINWLMVSDVPRYFFSSLHKLNLKLFGMLFTCNTAEAA
jgi:hypothetical protein